MLVQRPLWFPVVLWEISDDCRMILLHKAFKGSV